MIRNALSSGLAVAALAAAAWMPTVASAAAVDVVQSSTVHDTWFATSFEGAAGLVVGAQGKVLSTSDGGKTWTPGSVDTPLALLGAHVDASARLAVGQSGLIFRQAAGGPWAKVDSGTDKRLFAVDANAAGLAVAVGEFGVVLVSENGGTAWQPLTIEWSAFSQDGAEPHLYAVDVGADGTIVMTGEFGLVLRSVDRGKTWAAQHKGDASLFGLLLRDDGTGFAVGQDGVILRTSDHGTTWTDVASGTKSILLGVASEPGGRIGVSGMREMLVSSDAGLSWRRVTETEVTTHWFAAIAPAAQGGFLVMGQAGRVVRIGDDAALAAAPIALQAGGDAATGGPATIAN